MRRTLSWLVAGALVSGIGGASFADSEDSLTPLQDPPKMTIGNLYQVFNDNPESTAVNRILPSASQQTVRDGYRSNAVIGDANSGVVFPDPFEAEDSVDFKRVAPAGDSAPFYRQEVTVTTNGPTSSIERVGYCLINSEDLSVDGSDGEFKWYDAVDTNEINDLERNCGFNDDDPTSTGTPDSAHAVISIIYNVDTGNFVEQGDSQHEVPLGAGKAEASWNGQTLTVHFAFKPSHALPKQSSGWVIRAAAQDQPTANGNDFPEQVSQIFWGNTEQTEGEVTSVDASRDGWRFASVGYYGAIVSERSNVNFGPLQKGEEKVVTGITTGRYVSNAQNSLLVIHATPFTREAGGSQIDYRAEPDDARAENQVDYKCINNPDKSSIDDETGAITHLVSATPQILTTTLGATSSSSYTSPGNREGSEELGKLSCSLRYNGGATNAGEVYSNQVFISILDQTGNNLVPPIME